MKQHRLLALAITCLVLAPVAPCQDESTKTAPEPIDRVREGVKPPGVTNAPDPKFPKKERKARHQGTVILTLVVGSDGLPRDIKVSRTLSPEFDEAAMDAVKKWKFSPAMRDDKPIAVQIKVEVNFHLY